MATRVGAWDCSYCSNKGVPGYEYDCPGCGHPRPKGVRFYLPANAPIATPEQIEKMGNDPNWYCASCESGNLGSNNKCWNCGSPRGSDSVQHLTRVYEDGNIPRSTKESEDAEGVVAAEPQKEYVPKIDDPYNPPLIPINVIKKPLREETSRYEPPETSARNRSDEGRRWIKYGLIGAGVIAALFFVYLFFFRTVERTATVDGYSWSCNVVIEEYQTFHEGGWSVPAGGRQTGSETRQSGTRKVIDGYHTEQQPDTCYKTVHHPKTCTRDNGNGSYTDYDCSYDTQESYSCTKSVQVEDSHVEPVYDTWYFYDIDRWTAVANYPSSGTDHSPYYDPAQPVGALQRRVEQQCVYTVYFVSDYVDPFNRNYDLATWSTFDYGQEHVIVVNTFKIVLEVK